MTLVTMDKEKRDYSLHYDFKAIDTLAIVGASDKAIMLPFGGITSVVYNIEGNGTLQACGMLEERIEADTAEWEDVPDGAEINPSTTALRQVNVAGTSELTVRCQ